MVSRLWPIRNGGELEDDGGTGGQAVISISGPGRSCKMGPDGVFPVSPLMSISGLSGIFLLTRPVPNASSVSGCGCSDSVLTMLPTFSGLESLIGQLESAISMSYSKGGVMQHLPIGLVSLLAGQRWRPSPAEKPENPGGDRDGPVPFLHSAYRTSGYGEINTEAYWVRKRTGATQFTNIFFQFLGKYA